MGSKVTAPMKSVTALLILALIWSGVSDRLIRLKSDESDLLIFCIGLRRLITRGTSSRGRGKQRREIGREGGDREVMGQERKEVSDDRGEEER